jgi:hypothetical protein
LGLGPGLGCASCLVGSLRVGAQQLLPLRVGGTWIGLGLGLGPAPRVRAGVTARARVRVGARARGWL